MDQGVPSADALNLALNQVKKWCDQGEKVLFHCVGGLGRSGLAAACFHKKFSGIEGNEAIKLVRKCRSSRAVENELQENFVLKFN